jgi:carbamoyl-phosphate synthase large subunit
MKTTGEVMGLDSDFGLAFAKSQEAAGNNLPRSDRFLSALKTACVVYNIHG